MVYLNNVQMITVFQKSKGVHLVVVINEVIYNHLYLKQNSIHDYKYTYAQSVYINNSTNVIVCCKKHSPFTVTPANHTLRKSGCPSCKTVTLKGRYEQEYFTRNPDDITKPASLYIILVTDKSTNVQFYKIGITTRTAHKRYQGYFKYFNIQILIEESMQLYNAFQLEQHVLRTLKMYQYFPNCKKFAGFTECFYYSPLVTNKMLQLLEPDSRQEYTTSIHKESPKNIR